VAGETVDEVILAPVGLVRDDNNVPPLGEYGMPVALFLREELLDRREDDTAGC
jgi:hypothetical protein